MCIKINLVNKKGQMRMQETAFFLLAIILLFAILFILYINLTIRSYQRQSLYLGEMKAINLLPKFMGSAEFSCRNSLCVGCSACVDSDKAMAVSEVLKLGNFSQDYKKVWRGIAGIDIIRIYPKYNNIICDSGTYPNCNIIRVYNSGAKNYIGYSTFVDICREEKNGEKECGIGKIIVYMEKI